MKRLLAILLGLWTLSAMAVNVNQMPTVRIQPNGDTLHCFVTGDEYYHRFHDARGYTLLQHPSTGYWVYADTLVTAPGQWELVPTSWVAGSVDPAQVGLTPHLTLDRAHWSVLQKRYDVPQQYRPDTPKTSGRNHGTINNIVIFIRFSDDTEISTPFNTINGMFNDSSATSTSMYAYFRKASYNKLSIVTHYAPTPNNNIVVSYQDSLPRSRFVPYDATTNPNGYTNDNQARDLEFGLLQRAVNYINANYPISSSLNLDYNNDGLVDNVCFVLKGTYTGWSDLLWPHKWSLYDRYVYINNKRVYTFNLQLEGSGTHYFSSSTFCHETFHTLGAPDLYRYYDDSGVSGFGSWDLMCSNTTPPQHMNAYMKYKYGNWLDSIPTIRVPGTYTLHSLADTTNFNNCYKIASQDSNQWYILEYRDYTERFETALPGKGLIIYRVDTRFDGNAGYDGEEVFDEIYLFRPGGINDSTNGTTSQAYFSGNTSRTAFTPSTNPFPWLTQNILDTTLSITNITAPGETISFTYSDLRGCRTPGNLTATHITGTSAQLNWEGNSNTYRLRYRQQGQTSYQETLVNAQNYTLSGLTLNTTYEWQIIALCSDEDSSSWSSWTSFHTEICLIPNVTQHAQGDQNSYYLPVNTYYNYTYSQMIYPASVVGGEQTINKIAFRYAGSTPLSSKTDVTIYMGHTSQSSFSGTSLSSLIPFSSLQAVYSGSLNGSQGWILLTLSTPFEYNGTSNLVIAIDDNSGDYDGSSYTFSCTNTNGYSSLVYYSDYQNYDPATSTSYSGSSSRKQMLPDITFYGCPPVSSYTLTLHNPDSAMGTVTGEGIYLDGSEVTVTATPVEHHHFVAWTTDSGDSLYANPYTFTLSEDITLTAHFAVNNYHISVSADSAAYGSAHYLLNDDATPRQEGSHPYGTTVQLVAVPSEANPNNAFACWSDGSVDNPRQLQLAGDVNLVAHFIHTPPVAIQQAGESIRIQSGKGHILVSGTQGSIVRLYDITGRQLSQQQGKDPLRFDVPHAGTYLIQVEGQPAQKVIVL